MSAKFQLTSGAGLNHIPEVDSDDNFDEKNIFQNGTPMKFVDHDEKVDSDKIKMKVFDFNPILVRYLQTLVNIEYNKEKLKQRRDSSIAPTYFHNTNNERRLVDSAIYDIMSLAFYLSSNHDQFLDIPPLNDACMFFTHNFILINKHGDPIMVQKQKPGNTSSCHMFNKLVTKHYPNTNSRIIPNAANTRPNIQGILPDPKLSDRLSHDIEVSIDNMARADNTLDSVRDRYKHIIEEHKENVSDSQSRTKCRAEHLNNYFYFLKSDMERDILGEDGNEDILKIGVNMYPEHVYRNSANRKHHPINFDQAYVDRPRLDSVLYPNTVYVDNIGFCSLTNICHNSVLTLKNSSVVLNNMVNRCSNIENYKCYHKHDMEHSDDDAYDNTGENIIENIDVVSHVPKRMKPSSDNTVLLCGSGAGGTSNYDYSAYTRVRGCPATFNNYTYKYEPTKC